MSDFSERKIEELLAEPDILDTLRWLSTDRGWQGWVYETARRAADEIERLRQGIWDACLVLGMDGDGNDSPRHRVYPHLADLIVEEAERMRADYEQALLDD